MNWALAAVVAVIGLAACAPEVKVANDKGEVVSVKAGAAEGEGYHLQVLDIEENVQVFLVTAPDGRQAAARKAGDVSEVLTAEDAKALIEKHGKALAAVAGAPGGEEVKIKIPFLGIEVNQPDGEGGPAQVSVNAGGAKVEVNTTGDGPGELAHVRISGVGAKDAGEFIDDIEGLSAEVKAQMKKDLGL